MPESVNDIVIFSNFPCMIIVGAVIVLLLLSYFIKPLTLVFRLFALIFWIFQVVWQICNGATMQELVVVWLIQLLVFWVTTTIPSKTRPLPKPEDEKKEKQETKEESL